MAGTCISIIKLIGLGGLGLLTTQLNYQFFQTIPNLISTITNSNIYSNSSTATLIKNHIFNSRVIQGLLNVLSTTCFITAYNYSSIDEQHPYLLYSAIPASLIYLLYQNYSVEEKVLSKSSSTTTSSSTISTEHPLSDSDDFVHLSESGDSTPSTHPSSPKSKQDLEIDKEVESTLLKKEISNDLKKIQFGYKVGGIVSGISFVIATIGLIGDFYLL